MALVHALAARPPLPTHSISPSRTYGAPPLPLPAAAMRALGWSQRSPPPRAPRCSASREREFERLFSNLNQATMKREPGSVTGGVFLVAGTTVGAGILAIPAVTQEAGFLASSVACILCWIYMVLTGLLIAEVNVNTMCELGSGGVSLVSMAMRTLGKAGVRIACGSYIFIHYAVLVAYVARSSDILTNIFGIPFAMFALALAYCIFLGWESATLFSLVFGGICYFGSQRVIGLANGLLVFGIVASFSALVGVASGNLHWDLLLKANFQAVPLSIPILALSFVYQNVVPVLCTNLEGNLSKVRTAIILGTAIPLILFLVWDAVVLGTIPFTGSSGEQMIDPLEQLRSNNGTVGPIVEVFSFLAIATSYIGFVLGLSDFLSDFLKLPTGKSRPLPYMLTLLPPLVLSLLDPDVFFKALDFAGTYGGVNVSFKNLDPPQPTAITGRIRSFLTTKVGFKMLPAISDVLVLFGIFPAAMSWSERYSDALESPRVPPLVPGGRLMLSTIIGGASLIILSEIYENITRL